VKATRQGGKTKVFFTKGACDQLKTSFVAAGATALAATTGRATIERQERKKKPNKRRPDCASRRGLSLGLRYCRI